MKYLFQFVILVIVLVFTGCTKEFSQIDSKNYYNVKFESVVQFLKTNFPERLISLDLESIKELHYNDHNLGYQIFEKYNNSKFLLIRKDLTGYSGGWVDLTELNNNKFNKYSGKIRIQRLEDKIKTELKIENSKVTELLRWDNSVSTVIPISSIVKQNKSQNGRVEKKGNLEDYIVLPEVIIVANEKSFLSLFWLYNTYAAYNYYYIEGLNTHSSENNSVKNGNLAPGNNNNNVIAVPVFDGPKTPIKSLVDELKCFTINPASSYSVSVNVNQPRPGSRDKVDPSNYFVAGHAFLSLEQINSDGSKIVRNVGFYPQNSVYPGKFEDVSVFGDDSETPFSVSLKMAVTGQQMNTVLNSLLKQQSIPYDIESSNCVSAVGSSLRKINIHIPMTVSGIEIIYQGVNPGDLGQDIRNLDLNYFSENNGLKNVWRTLKDDNIIRPPQRIGSCQ